IREANMMGDNEQYGSHHIVRAHLPNQQRTTVHIPDGMTVREALDKAMRLRRLNPEMCNVYRQSPKTNLKTRMDWDEGVSMLPGDEIVVEAKDRFPMHTQISHNFAPKTFFTLAYCDCCQRFIFNGLRCLTCGIRFHSRCSSAVPSLCQPFRAVEHNNYYRHLLARDSRTDPSLFCPSTPTEKSPHSRGAASLAPPSPRHNLSSSTYIQATPRIQHSPNQASLPRERSTSAPNVSFNLLSPDSFQALDHPALGSINFNYYPPLPGDPSTLCYPCMNGASFQPLVNADTQTSHDSTSSATEGSPSRTQSAAGSPTGSNRQSRPRARSADESSKKLKERDKDKDKDKDNKEKENSIAVNKSNENNANGNNRKSFEDDWEIDGTKVLQGRRIGSGSFGTVYLGIYHGPVALKKLNVVEPTPAQLQAFKNEVAVLRKARHVNIILFMGCVSKPRLTIVTQLCQGSSLYKHLHVLETPFEPLQILEVARETAQGMDYLHAKNIIHRDLKSNNIFLHDDLTVKIGDFGLATVKTRWEGNQQFNYPTGSILWMAPEVMRSKEGNNPFTFESDVYSYGIVLYELVTGSLPFQGVNNKDALIYLIGNHILKLDMSKARPRTPKSLINLIKLCTDANRENRPLFKSILGSLDAIKMPQIKRSTSEPTSLNNLKKLVAADNFL
ncbi:RAF proto-oncogene serine/threonine-protein kinase, partial [Fragariocoptes setiger]